MLPRLRRFYDNLRARAVAARRVRLVPALLAGALAAAAPGAAGQHAGGAARGDFDEGMRRYEAGEFAAARDAFERAAERAPRESDYQHWLGKAYGRLAERSNPFSALTYATRTRRLFERAVELDGRNRAALVSLMEYYEEAPGFLGGDADKAAAIRARIAALDAERPPPADAPDIEPEDLERPGR